MLSLNIKTALAMRAAFLMRFGFSIINHSIVLVTWIFLFRVVPVVREWNFWHLLMAYGLAWFTWGFVSFFAHGYKILPRTIEFGELDHFLLQPRPLLLMLAGNNGEVFGAQDMVLSLAVIILAGIKIHVAWMLVIFGLVCSSVVFTSFTLLIGSIAFWLNDMHDWLLDTQYNLYIFASRPASAFQGWVKVVMFSILPMGFISYLPVEIMRLNDPSLILVQIAGTLAIVAMAWTVFRLGLKRYESGNRFGVRT